MAPKDDNKKKDAGKSAKKDKDPVNKSGQGQKEEMVQRQSEDKLNNLALVDKATYDTLCKEVHNSKLVTPAVVSKRLKIRGFSARAALQELLSKGSNKLVSKHRAQIIYTRINNGGAAPVAGGDAKAGPTN